MAKLQERFDYSRPHSSPQFVGRHSDRVDKLLHEIDGLTLSELAEMRSAWYERYGDYRKPPRTRRDRDVDEPDRPEGGAGVREPRPVIPPAGSAGAAVDPKEDADLPDEVGRPRTK
jgi:hypothetical protein